VLTKQQNQLVGAGSGSGYGCRHKHGGKVREGAGARDGRGPGRGGGVGCSLPQGTKIVTATPLSENRRDTLESACKAPWYRFTTFQGKELVVGCD
jgi:hypothetical protein